MKRILGTLLLLLIGAKALASTGASVSGAKIAWQPWSESIFSQARDARRLVILDLEAVWCHWCHVMERETYASPEVVALIGENFLPVRVDQDSRPDLANRYRDYGWPATIVFDASGRELAKRAGYIPAEEMIGLLRRILKNPDQRLADEESRDAAQVPQVGALTENLLEELRRRHRNAQDDALGGLRLNHKFLDADSVEYSLRLARAGEEAEVARARLSLDSNLSLIDPVWGGVYQYSHGGTWQNPHYEKIMSFQRDNLRLYSLAYSQWGDPRYLRAAQAIKEYLKRFLLSPEGGFYTSQDADLVRGQHSETYFALDDAGRRALGLPRVDRNRYARQNGWAIEGLVALYRVSGDAEALSMAREAADWARKHRALDRNAFVAAQWLAAHGVSPVGGFSHGDRDAAGPYFGDTLAMGRGFLALYAATGERDWLRGAERAAKFLGENFQDSSGAGYISAYSQGPLRPLPSIEENISAARFWNLLFHYSGSSEYRGYAERALRYLSSREVATQRLTEPGILMVEEEFRSQPVHITVVGSKSDTQALALFQKAISYPSEYLRVEWWDRREGPIPNPDVRYPEMKQSAAFVCSDGICSSPIFSPQEILRRIEKITRIRRS